MLLFRFFLIRHNGRVSPLIPFGISFRLPDRLVLQGIRERFYMWTFAWLSSFLTDLACRTHTSINFAKVEFYLFSERDVYFVCSDFIIRMFGEAETALLRSNSSRNSRPKEVTKGHGLKSSFGLGLFTSTCLPMPKKTFFYPDFCKVVNEPVKYGA